MGGLRGVRAPKPTVRSGPVAADEAMRAADLHEVLAEILPVELSEDSALTVGHDGTFASLRPVTIADGLQMVALTQMLAWDLPSTTICAEPLPSRRGRPPSAQSRWSHGEIRRTWCCATTFRPGLERLGTSNSGDAGPGHRCGGPADRRGLNWWVVRRIGRPGLTPFLPAAGDGAPRGRALSRIVFAKNSGISL